VKKIKRDIWDETFKKKGKIFTTPQEDIPRIVKLFKKHYVKKVLDLGCGSGRHLVYLAKHGFDVFGIDISKHGIKIAKTWLKKEGLKANLRISDIYKKLPYKNNFFDAIVTIQTLHHEKIEEIRKLIKEIERILKPNGLIFVTVLKYAPKKCIPKDKLELKFIAPRTYIFLGGLDKNLPHYQFNRNILKKEFRNFKILDLWVESKTSLFHRHYCLLGQLKNKK
jgi:cyclopropane fatty-acyl-phospholipid synthase-like methyltransferase